MMLLSEAAEKVGGTLVGRDREFDGVSIDSRTLAKNDLFVAIDGDKFDGHSFVDRALASGACAALVERITNVAISQIKVADTTVALGKLAKSWRSDFSIPVIGITGSNGKTTVTAMVRHIVAKNHKPLFPEQSFNNQWGVPLTLLRLSDHSHAVIEMGMNHAGEIDYLAQIAAPTVAVINNAAAAHLEGLGDVDQVAIAKGEIIDALSMDGVAILNADDGHFEFWRRQADTRKVVSFALEAEADFRASEIVCHADNSTFVLHAHSESLPVKLPLPGRHNIMNALAAAAASHTAGIPLSDIASGLLDVEGIAGRLTPAVTAAGARLIDDSFNANPASIAAAIEVLSNSSGKTILVLGAMAELGADSQALHRETAELASSTGIDRLLYLDDESNADLKGYRDGFAAGAERFDSVGALVAALETDNDEGSVILVKGSKSSNMGRVVDRLKTNTTRKESSLC